MKTKIGILVLVLCTSFFNLHAQRRVYTTTARATSQDISDNLDLEAVASVFGESKDLEEFEYKLNDPNNRISNLDLNEDGYIDYLRVVENSSDRNSQVVIQAVLDQDIYQDVATIDVERVSNGNPRIQIVGDSYIYGSNYIIEPVFVRTPLIFSFFWGPRYTIWSSPYYWNHYPEWYRYYRPYSPYKYRRHVFAHIDFGNRYHHVNTPFIYYSHDNWDRIRRNDYAKRYPNKAFENRHQGINNRNELIQRRSDRSLNYNQNNIYRPNSTIRQNSRNSNSGQYEQQRSTNQYQQPANQRNSQQTPAKEYKRNSNRYQPQYNNTQTEQKSTETYKSRTETQSRPSVNQERQSRPAEVQRQETKTREKSARPQERSRSRNTVKESQPKPQKAESSKKEEKKENRERRRNE